LEDKPGEHLDVLLGGRVVARYMYAYDTSSPERRFETYKPYLHVFDAEGTRPITNGPAGLYPHHRGIFIGWSRLGFQGRSCDLWGMGGGDMVHQGFRDRHASAHQASFTALVRWNAKTGETILEEYRTITVRPAAKPCRLVIDFVSTLSAPRSEVALGGDPEHAGVHYRPANELDKARTLYVFPREKADPRVDLDYPWVGESYTLAGRRHSVVLMNHPENPKGTKYSAYRDYGRFGAFFVGSVRPSQPLTLRYRFLVADGEMPEAEVIQKCWDEFAGVKGPSPVPKTTVIPVASRPAEKGKAKAPGKPAARAK